MIPPISQENRRGQKITFHHHHVGRFPFSPSDSPSTLFQPVLSLRVDIHGLHQLCDPLDTSWFSQWVDQRIEGRRRVKYRALYPWLSPFWSIDWQLLHFFIIKVPARHVTLSSKFISTARAPLGSNSSLSAWLLKSMVVTAIAHMRCFPSS